MAKKKKVHSELDQVLGVAAILRESQKTKRIMIEMSGTEWLDFQVDMFKRGLDLPAGAKIKSFPKVIPLRARAR